MGIITDLKNYAKQNHVPIMQDEGINFVCNYIKENNVKNILEIGSAIGYSAIVFAMTNDNVHVTTIERDDTMYKEACKNIEKAKLEERIVLLHDDALTCEIVGTFDLIFIDAAKGQYLKFFEKYKNNLSQKGSIICDNLLFHGMVANPSLTHNRNTLQLIRKIQNFTDFLKNNTSFDTTFYELGDGISVSKWKTEL